MKETRKRLVIATAALAVLVGGSFMGSSAIPAGASAASGCSAHGNIAPPLISMKARYPERAKLNAQIADASKLNPETMMPLFGTHEIISEAEIDKIVDFVLSL